MSTTKTLVSNAIDRKYSEFETNALEALKAKFMASSALQDSLSKLAVAKGLTEAEAEKEEDEDEDEGAEDKDDKGSEEGSEEGSDDEDEDKDED